MKYYRARMSGKSTMTFVDIVKRTIRCPLFMYAIIDFDNYKLTYKLKPFKLFFKTFGKRVVKIIDLPKMEFDTVYE